MFTDKFFIGERSIRCLSSTVPQPQVGPTMPCTLKMRVHPGNNASARKEARIEVAIANQAWVRRVKLTPLYADNGSHFTAKQVF